MTRHYMTPMFLLLVRERAEIGVFGNGEIGGHRNCNADGSDEEGLKFIMILSVFICVLCGWIGVGGASESAVLEIQEEAILLPQKI